MSHRILGAVAALALATSSAPASAQAGLSSKPEQLLYVALQTADFAKAREFYTVVIGLKEMPGSNPAAKPIPSSMLSFSGGYGDTFLMISQGPARPAPGGALQRLVFKVADAKAVIERARSAGATIKTEAGPAHGMKTLIVGSILDPDGNLIELVQTES